MVNDETHSAVGLSGANACVVCDRSTDTGIGFVGETGCVLAALAQLGVDEAQAEVMLAERTGDSLEMVPDGAISLAFAFCAECAARSGNPSLQVGALSAPDGVPHYMLMQARSDEM